MRVHELPSDGGIEIFHWCSVEFFLSKVQRTAFVHLCVNSFLICNHTVII